jgi:hypothetical protein
MDVAFKGEVGVLGVSPLPAAMKMNGRRFQTFPDPKQRSTTEQSLCQHATSSLETYSNNMRRRNGQ